MESIKTEKRESISQNRTENEFDPYLNQSPSEIDIRVFLRDTYAKMFSKGFSLDMMAYADFNCMNCIIGRIEVIEFLAFGLWEMPLHNPFKNQDEILYFNWLRGIYVGKRS